MIPSRLHSRVKSLAVIPTLLYGLGTLYVLSLAALAVGLWTRWASITAWFLHWMFMNTGSTTNYGADSFAHIFLFYLIWVPAGATFSIDEWRGGKSAEASSLARLGLRVLQLHLCLSYLASGLETAAGPQWWNGELLWRAFSLPVYHVFDMNWLSNWPGLSKVGGWATLVVELGYPVFIWPKQTRRTWVILTAGLHVGIAVFLGLGIFGAVMAVLTLALFGVSSEPKAASELTQTVSADGGPAPQRLLWTGRVAPVNGPD